MIEQRLTDAPGEVKRGLRAQILGRTEIGCLRLAYNATSTAPETFLSPGRRCR
jgi:hypothetical protein